MKISSLITIFTVSAFFFAVGDAYMLPYRSRYGDTWDAVVDPFEILEGLTTDIEDVALAEADWKETADFHIFTLDVPGTKRDEIKIEVEDKRVLRISGERRKEEEKQYENNKWHRMERSVGKVVRQFKLPEDVDRDGVKASLEGGVMTVTDEWHRVERSVGKVVRQFKLSGDVDMDGVKASLESGVLTVTDKWHRVERSVGKVVRRFKLSEDVDMDGAKASVESGVLTVAVPKIKDPSSKDPKLIPIQESDAESRAAL